MKEKIKSMGAWFKERETKKEKIARDITNIVDARLDGIVNHAIDKLNFAFEVMYENDNLKIENHNLNLELKAEREKNEIISAENEKNHIYLEKLLKVIKTNDEKLLKEIDDLKSDRYKVKKITPAVPKKGQDIGINGIKSGAKNSRIIKEVLK